MSDPSLLSGSPTISLSLPNGASTPPDPTPLLSFHFLTAYQRAHIEAPLDSELFVFLESPFDTEKSISELLWAK